MTPWTLVPVAALLPQLAAAAQWTSSVALTSDYRVHGLQRSAGKPAMQAHVGLVGDRRWSAGAWVSTVDLHPGPGPRREIDLYAAFYSQLSRDWQLQGQLTHYEFVGDAALSYDYTEATVSAAFRESITATVGVVPEMSLYSNGITARNRMALSYELSGRRPVTRNVQLTAGVGYSDLRDLVGAAHWYWSGAAELGIRRLRLAVSYVGTDSTAVSLFGPDKAGDALIATIDYRLF